MTDITCPNCANKLPVTDAAADYDWESGVYYGGVKEVTCPYCRKELTVYAQATVDIEEVSAMTKTFWNSDSKDIAEAIAKHPDLPVYFNIPNDELAVGYTSTLHERHHVEVCTMWRYVGDTFWDESDLIDQIADDVYDEGLFERSDDCIKEARIRFEKLPSQDCILIHTSA